jgi:Zn-dependent peptidase ImmA (M78 family)
MNLLLAQIKRKVPDWNKRALTERDFFRLCRRERPNIRVHTIPLRVPGFLMIVRGVPHLYLDDQLRGVQWLKVAFHELAHYYFHTPLSSYAAKFYRVQPNSKEEHEAELFALTALIPDSLLMKFLASEEYFEDWGFAGEIMKERSNLFIRYATN